MTVLPPTEPGGYGYHLPHYSKAPLAADPADHATIETSFKFSGWFPPKVLRLCQRIPNYVSKKIGLLNTFLGRQCLCICMHRANTMMIAYFAGNDCLSATKISFQDRPYIVV
jgi:hypothetical protein